MAAMLTVQHFAYGSNMAATVLEGRRGVRPLSKQPAVVHGRRLAFSAIGLPPWEPAFASLDPSADPADCCHGVLYTLSLTDWARLCLSEGLPLGGYRVVTVTAVAYPPGGAAPASRRGGAGGLEALSLAFEQPQTALGLPRRELTPSCRYMALLRQGAAQAGLEEAWQRKLAALPCV